MPTPTLEPGDIKFAKPRVNSHTKPVDQGYEDKVVEKREFWHWFWLVSKKETVRFKRPDKQKEYYTVSLQEIVNEANRLVEGNIKNIKLGVNQYLNEDFKQRVAAFLNNLDCYLSNYCENLVQAQKDQKLKADEKDKLAK